MILLCHSLSASPSAEHDLCELFEQLGDVGGDVRPGILGCGNEDSYQEWIQLKSMYVFESAERFLRLRLR